MKTIPGIHHVTAFAGDPQRNMDFYTRALGLRLLKLTVNFDDPGLYHLYYGDGAGAPGTVMTFFPIPGAKRGPIGNGQVTVTSFLVPPGAIAYWERRLAEFNAKTARLEPRFGENVLSFADPDGLRLELIESEPPTGAAGWGEGGVPADAAIRGFHSVTLGEDDAARTAPVLDVLGFTRAAEAGQRTRYVMGDGLARFVDVLHRPGAPVGRAGAGTVHHVAWRARDAAEQLAWQRAVSEAGLGVTDVRDRQYFRSIYFREPGGVLFEIATDAPGFFTDEDERTLGTALKLPPWLEPQRARIAQALPALKLPGQ